MNWQAMGAVAPRSLSDARLELHYAALILGSTAHTVLDPVEDDSHANLGLDTQHRSLHTRPLGAEGELHLELLTMKLVLRDGTRVRDQFPLAGQTVAGGLAWVGAHLGATPIAIEPRQYSDFPDPQHALARGERFGSPAEAQLAELTRWFENGWVLFEELRRMHPPLGELRIWPHHFDLGVLLPLDAGGERTLGLGLSPGDKHYDQPYLYCSPYPAPPKGADKPELSVGHWHTRGFLSAVATAEELLANAPDGDAAREYLRSAVAACSSLLAAR